MQKLFPRLDYTRITEKDEYFQKYEGRREPLEDHARRALSFLLEMMATKEKCIAVSAHSTWLQHVFASVGDCGDDEELSSRFKTGEFRAVWFALVEDEK